MQFEEFDKKIKEAADNHHPAYNEQAWGRMNKLLDKHLPLKEDRRRRFILFFLLFFILGGAGIVFTIKSVLNKESSLTDTPAAVIVNKKEAALPVSPAAGTAVKETPAKKEIPGIPAINNSGEPLSVKPAPKDLVSVSGQPKQPANPVDISRFPSGNRNPVITSPGITQMKRKRVAPKQDTRQVLPDPGTVPPLSADGIVKQDAPVTQDKPVLVPATAIPVTAAGTDEKKRDEPAASAEGTGKKEDSAVTAALTPPAPPEQKKKTAGKPKKSSLFFTVSAGPDASFAPAGKPGRLTPVTGVGIGYTYKERFTLRTGFYQATKIYSASPEDYNPPSNFYNYYPYLEKVDANCRVYEIPVSLGYQFGARKNHSWFASAGLSSYLMKRETYDYYYKTSAWGSTQQKEWTISNRNQHLFSVLGLSAGYQRKITDRVSFIAEPYMKMPLTGVGYGKVRLNSAGILFTVTVQPAALIPRKQKK